MSRFPYFSAAELACRCGDCTLGEDDMDPRFMRRVIDLRKKCDFPFVVTSAIRCPAHNAVVSSTGLSGPHTPISVGNGSPETGHAMDIRVQGHSAFKLLSLARQYGITGIGAQQRGRHESRFCHLDDLPEAPGRPREWLWTYP